MIYMDNDYIGIKYYECVMLLDSRVIEIKMARGKLKITGEDLVIRYYSDQEVVVCGKVDCLRFLWN